MSKHDGKSVKFAVLHQPIFAPGYGQLPANLSGSGVNSGIDKAVKMTIQEPYVLIEAKDQVGKPVEILVPLSGFTHLVLAL